MDGMRTDPNSPGDHGPLVRKAQSGDPESREALARTWLRPAYGVALALTGRAADAEDAVQEAFCRAFASLPTLRNADRFGPWLVRIVRNVVRDRARRPEAPRLLGDADAALLEREESAEDGDAVHAWRHLPEDERLVCWLKIVDGMTIRALADLLGTSKSAVDRTFRRGLARLRGEMSRC